MNNPETEPKPEIEKKARLTPYEKTAVYNFLVAAKALPKSICIEVDDDWEEEGNLRVSKRITSGSCRQVASLRKKSLNFRRTPSSGAATTHHEKTMQTNTQSTEGKDPQQTKDESSLDGATCCASFTPGPWKADGYHVRQSGQRGTRMIADVCYTGPHHTSPEEYPKSCRLVDEANARLIAAAPLMLEAINYVLYHPVTFVDNTVAAMLEAARDSAILNNAQAHVPAHEY